MRFLRITVVAPLLALMQLAALSQPVAAQESPQTDLKLVVTIVVDQFRTDYLTRFDSLYTGGLARLSHRGFVFAKGFHNHAQTETGPGHATIATGLYPKTHGIIGNSWFDTATGKTVYCLEDSTSTITERPGKKGRSPVNMRRGGLSDWLNRTTPASKVFSVALKDRAAIAMASYGADGAYWYDSNSGTMVTALFYSAIYPPWAANFNNSQPAQDYYSGVWDRFAPSKAYRFSGPDSVTAEADGKDIVFPHNFAARPNQEPSVLFQNLLSTPFADLLALRFTRKLVEAESLGVDDTVDLLMLGCSAADYVGHTYGPHSHEVQDYYLRLDLYLGEFFAFLDSTVGVDRYAVALSSDHGVLDLPENLQKQGIDAGRIHPDTLKNAVMAAGLSAANSLGLTKNIIRHYDYAVYLDFTESAASGISNSRVQDAMAAELRNIPYIVDAYTADEMMASGGTPREYLSLYRNNYFEGRSPHVMFRLKENYIIDGSPYGTTHGSCYGYDTEVPIIFFGPNITAQWSDHPAQTVDIAPTLAEIMKINYFGQIDGHSLLQLIKK